MAKRLLSPPDFTRPKPPGRTGFDFTPYIDGDAWELTRGEDYFTRPDAVKRGANKFAKANGYELDTRVYTEAGDTPERVVIRFRKVPTAN
jgi:hypothetical protein